MTRVNAITNPLAAVNVAGWTGTPSVERLTRAPHMIPGPGTACFHVPAASGGCGLVSAALTLPAAPGEWLAVQLQALASGATEVEAAIHVFMAWSGSSTATSDVVAAGALPLTAFARLAAMVQVPGDATGGALHVVAMPLSTGGADAAELYLTALMVEAGSEGGAVAAYPLPEAPVKTVTAPSALNPGLAYAPDPGGIIPHRLMGQIGFSVGEHDYTEYAESLVYDTIDTGGYSAASFQLRPSQAPPSYDADAVLSRGTEVLWRGVVTAAPTWDTAPDLLPYAVTLDGPSCRYGRSGDFAMAFLDRDVGQWQGADCGGWPSVSPVTLSADPATLTICAPASEELAAWQQANIEALVGYPNGNACPEYSPDDFTAPPAVWTALVYHVQGGLTEDLITKFICGAKWDFSCPRLAALTTPDYANPIAPDDFAVNGNRFATYPDINLWTGFYGMASAPGTMWAGLYACADLAELPVGEPLTMLTRTTGLLHRFEPGTSGELTGETALSANAPEGSKYIVLYVSLVPVQTPVWMGTYYTGDNTYGAAATAYDATRQRFDDLVSALGGFPSGATIDEAVADAQAFSTAYDAAATAIGKVASDNDPNSGVGGTEATADAAAAVAAVGATTASSFDNFAAFVKLEILDDTETIDSIDYLVRRDVSSYLLELRGLVPWAADCWTAARAAEQGGIVRSSVCALNRLYLDGTETITLSAPSVVCNGYPDYETNNLTECIRRILPDCNVVGDELLADAFVPTLGNATSGLSLMVRPHSTRLAAIQSLLALHAAQTVWGWYDNVGGAAFQVAAPDFGSVAVDDSQPGAQFVVSDKTDGIIDSCTVLYTPQAPTGGAAQDPGARIALSEIASVCVDKDGNECAPAQRGDVIDMTTVCGDRASAIAAGMKEIATRGIGQYDGTAYLFSVDGAAVLRAGKTLNGALVTRTSYDVGHDVATVQFGGTGYVGRFPPKPGQPLSASPHIGPRLTMADVRREVMRGRR